VEDESDDSFSHSVRLSALELLLVCIPFCFYADGIIRVVFSQLQMSSKKKQELVYGKLYSKLELYAF
jgi:hypothetical protein